MGRGRPVTTGLYELDNTSATPVTVQSVSLSSPQGLHMTKSWLVPIFHDPKTGNWVDIGVGDAYPPTTARNGCTGNLP